MVHPFLQSTAQRLLFRIMLYQALINIYSIAIFLSSKFGNEKAKKWVNGRKNWRQNIEKLPKNSTLFHCASLGEFDQGAPVIEAWKKKFPNETILVSFFSPSGMEHHHKRGIQLDGVCYMPIDTRKNMRDFLNLVAPKRIFLIKYEFWPNLINEAFACKIPVFSLATLLRPNQLYFKWYGTFFRKSIRKVTHFFTQNSETNALLTSIDCNQFTLVGDPRFDTVIARKAQRIPDDKMVNFIANKSAIILGSAWEKEAEILASCLDHFDNDKIIIAPHEINSNSIGRLKKLFPQALCYTDQALDSKKQILILDTIGQLANAYAHGDVAFVGGGYHGSLHNILEPAVYGLPICFGPKHSKFPEASQFLKNEFAREIISGEDLVIFINEMRNQRDCVSSKILAFVEQEQGATKRILAYFP